MYLLPFRDAVKDGVPLFPNQTPIQGMGKVKTSDQKNAVTGFEF